MPAILVILLLFIGVFFIVSGNMQSPQDVAKSYRVKTQESYNRNRDEFKQMSFDIGRMRGKDLLYIDRRVFRESLKQHIEKEGKFKIKYNPFMEIDITVNQKVVEKKFYKALNKGTKQYRVKKKLIVHLKYAIYNSKKVAIYKDEFTYRVILKVGSTISYKEADHKLHRKLFWILGKIVASRLNKNYKKVGSNFY